MKRKACSHSDEFLGELMDNTSFIRTKRFTGGLTGDMERWNDAAIPKNFGSTEYHTMNNPVLDESFSPR